MATAALSALEEAEGHHMHDRQRVHAEERLERGEQSLGCDKPSATRAHAHAIRTCGVRWHPRGDVHLDREGIYSTQLAGPQVQLL
jgi:hypothetical protein